MAVTHADLAPGRGKSDLESKFGAFLIVSTILCGLACFILCLVAEATRSEATWKTGSGAKECAYNGSGKTPLLCAASAFVGLAMAMMIEHTFMLVSVSKLPPSALVSLDPDSGSSPTLTCQAGFFFVATWICFAVGEILLLIGLSLESGHLKDWSTPRPSCLVIRQGLFSAAGVFALISVFLAAGLYLTALKAQRISEEHENVRLRILEAAPLYASPSPPPDTLPIAAVRRENPIASTDDHMFPNLPSYTTKDPNLVRY